MPDTHHTSGAGPGRDAPLRVIYSSPPALCCLGWVKTTPAENITSGQSCAGAAGSRMWRALGKALPGLVLADTAQCCAGMESRAARGRGAAAEAGAVPARAARSPRAGQSRARRLLPHCPCPCHIPLDDNQHLVRNPLRLRLPWPQSPVLCGEHTLF